MYPSKRLDSLLDMTSQEKEIMRIVCSPAGWYSEAKAVYYSRGGSPDSESEYIMTAIRRNGYDKYKTIAYIKRTCANKTRKYHAKNAKKNNSVSDSYTVYMQDKVQEAVSVEDELLEAENDYIVQLLRNLPNWEELIEEYNANPEGFDLESLKDKIKEYGNE